MRTVAHESSVRSSIRYGLVLLGIAAAFGCSGESVAITNPGIPIPMPAPSYSLTLSAPTLISIQGTSTRPTTISLVRTAFGGLVALSVANLPPGVDAHFSPGNPVSGSFSRLWFEVHEDAPTGTFTNLEVRGVASGLPDQTAPLTLTITAAPDFTLTLSSPALSVMQGTATLTTTVNVVRNIYTGPVTLWADAGDFHGTMPRGITAAFAPNPTTGASSVLTLSVSGAAMPGVYDIWVNAEATPEWSLEGPKLRLTINAAPSP